MPYLLDTHALIWLTDDLSRLGDSAQSILTEFPMDIHVSVVSIWEIAIKRSIGKLDIPVSAHELLQNLQRQSIPLLDINGRDAAQVESLPFHHRDPFDRLLASQAINNGLIVVSKDTIF